VKRPDPLPLVHHKVPRGGHTVTPSDAALVIDNVGNMTMLNPRGRKTAPQRLLSTIADKLNQPTTKGDKT